MGKTQSGINPIQTQHPHDVAVPVGDNKYFFKSLATLQLYYKDSKKNTYNIVGPLNDYANNAAALAAGLNPGDLYYTLTAGDGIVKVVL